MDGELLTDIDELAEPDGDPESNTNDLHLGNGMDLDRSYDGLLDDVRVYDELLSELEILSLAGAP